MCEKLTLEKAKNLTVGTILVQPDKNNYDGSLRRWKVTSVKTWKSKRNAHRVEIGLKHGLYSYDRIDQDSLHLVVIPSGYDDCDCND